MEEDKQGRISSSEGDNKQESIVENSCTFTEKVLSELYGKLMRKRLVIIFLIWIVIVITYVLMSWQEERKLYSDICLIIVTLVLMVEIIWLPKKQAKSICKKTKQLYNEYQNDTVHFYENHILVKNHSTNAELIITYDKIKCIVETRNLYCITLKVKSIITLDKNNFTKGTKQDFLTLIQSKNILKK